MNRLQWVVCVVVLVSLAACTQPQTREYAQSLIERGDYLVNGIMTGNHCHTTKDKACIHRRRIA